MRPAIFSIGLVGVGLPAEMGQLPTVPSRIPTGKTGFGHKVHVGSEAAYAER